MYGVPPRGHLHVQKFIDWAWCFQGLFKIAKREKVWDYGFKVELDPLMTASGLEKSDLGKNRFDSVLNMPYLNGKIIGTERVRSFIG